MTADPDPGFVEGIGVTRQNSPRTMSFWAGLAFVCSMTIFCPIATLAAPVLAVVALRDIAGHSHRYGRRLALAAIAISVLVTGAYIVGAVGWNANVRRPMLEGPSGALRAGMNGDVSTFQAAFTEPGSAEDARAFLDEVVERYGDLVVIRQDRSDRQSISPDQFTPHRMAVPYVVEFRRGPMSAEAEFVVARESGVAFIRNFVPGYDAGGRWGSIVIRDAERGDLVYPRPAGGAAGQHE